MDAYRKRVLAAAKDLRCLSVRKLLPEHEPKTLSILRTQSLEGRMDLLALVVVDVVESAATDSHPQGVRQSLTALSGTPLARKDATGNPIEPRQITRWFRKIVPPAPSNQEDFGSDIGDVGSGRTEASEHVAVYVCVVALVGFSERALCGERCLRLVLFWLSRHLAVFRHNARGLSPGPAEFFHDVPTWQ